MDTQSFNAGIELSDFSSISVPTSSKNEDSLMTTANNWEPDEDPQNQVPYLRSKLFETYIIIISATTLAGKNEFFAMF